VHLASSAARTHLTEDLAELGAVPPMLFAPTSGALSMALRDLPALDVAVGDSEYGEAIGGRVPVVEFGFSSHFDHALFERPSLGYRGWICFLDRIAHAL